MAEEDSLIAGAEDDPEATSVSASSSPSPSPSPSPSLSSSPKTCKQKIKLRCSHGGKIMVRPPDGHLKYIGGETRVVAVHRDITFSELMKKLGNLVDGEVVLKYQLVPEELDTLVCVRTDEDLKHMLEEYDRQESQSDIFKMRAYLFPSKLIVMECNPSLGSHALEQRYIDAINGIMRATPLPLQLRTAPSSGRPSFSISSPATSPPAPKVISPDKIQNPWEASSFSSPKSQLSMHRVRSSPSLHYGGESQQQAGSGSQYNRQQGGMYQVYRHQNLQSHGHPQNHGGLYPTNSLQPQDFYRGVGRMEHVRGGVVLSPGAMDRLYPSGGRTQKGSRGLYDDGGSNPIDRSDSLPHS